MADGYWNQQKASPLPAGSLLKRPRSDYELLPSGLPSTQEVQSYYLRDDDRGRYQAVKDTKTIGSAYDLYLQNAQVSLFASGETSTLSRMGLGRAVGGGMAGLQMLDSPTMDCPQTAGSDLAANSGNIGLGGQSQVNAMARPGRETAPLPPDASNTVYVEGLPPDSTRREVAHIFRPFVGYKELRLVSKESKHRGGDPIILCFVDFESPACAATALSALQGYRVDEHDPESNYLRLQFSRFPGPRSGPGNRGKRWVM